VLKTDVKLQSTNQPTS